MSLNLKFYFSKALNLYPEELSEEGPLQSIHQSLSIAKRKPCIDQCLHSPNHKNHFSKLRHNFLRVPFLFRIFHLNLGVQSSFCQLLYSFLQLVVLEYPEREDTTMYALRRLLSPRAGFPASSQTLDCHPRTL